ncbi:lamin tail domain-containing protein [Halorubrum aethiopicum]|uniref:lamin tail domain-containing protein n=1 Tax=Halorubrum aethiopicum TaxID=1758255 RepID=UPI0008306731|nr:lamin tail domain-containing protein [Halorubrum aethiopicum]
MSRRRLLSLLAVVTLVVLAGCATIPSDGGQQGPTIETNGDIGSENNETIPDGESTVTTPEGNLTVHMLNVGQGSSTLIIGPTGETILIDSGDWRDDGADVIDYLEARGITRIDHLVTSHADADHIGGHAGVIDHFETDGDGVGAVYDPGIAAGSATYESYLDAIEEHDVTLYQTQAGDSIAIEDVEAQVLAPPDDYLANDDRNENSLVIHLQFGSSSFLLPGDGETESEEYLVETYGSELNSTVLAVGHHGSQSSTSDVFLDTVSPRVALISSAYDSQYGHPHEEVLSRLDQRSIPTYWTGTHGHVRLTSNGSAVTVATQQDAPSRASALRDGEPVSDDADGGFTDRLVVPATGSAAPSTPDDSTSEDDTSDSAESTEDTNTTLAIVEIHADADGNDNENLNDEYVVLENTGETTLDLSGWTVADSADHTYTVPDGFKLGAGERVTIHSGSGTDTETDLYWGRSTAVWNNGGDTVIVTDASGTVVIEESY